jgi:hypothetical protein
MLLQMVKEAGWICLETKPLELLNVSSILDQSGELDATARVAYQQK